MGAGSVLQHAVSAFRADILGAAGAIESGDMGRLDGIFSRLREHPLTASVRDSVNSASENFDSFVGEVKQNAPAGKFIFGAGVLGMGVGALVNAAGVAAALGLAVISVEVIAIVIILYGISIMVPTLLKHAVERLQTKFASGE